MLLVCRQLIAFFEREHLLPTYHSAYRKNHSTETAVLKIVSDALLAADRGDVTHLGLLDLSAAFDTVEHDILIDHLQAAFGIRGIVLRWIDTFIRMRTQTVSFNGMQSTRSSPDCGVPQGSVLGPILIILYTDVTSIAQRHSLGVHSYADDTQLYCHSKAGPVKH